MTERTFGVEMEIIGLNQQEACAVLTGMGISAQVTGYSGYVPEGYWRIATDGSLRDANGNGHHSGGKCCEVISPILSGEASMALLRMVCDALSAAGGTANKTCGLHVHIGANDLSHEQMKAVCKRWVRDEPFIDLLVPESRRGNENPYCRSNAALFRSVDAAFKRIDRCSSRWELKSVMQDERFFKMNLAAYAEHGTIEFRQHSGTCEADKVCNWVSFLLCLFEKPLTKGARKWNQANFSFPTEKKIHYLCLVAGCSNEVRRYWMKRAIELEKAIEARRNRAARQRGARQAQAA